MKKYLVILQQTPFSNSHSLEALELSMALTAFNQPVSLLFSSTSVLQLLLNKKPKLIAQKDFTQAFAGLDLFNIEHVYVEQAALENYNLNPAQLQISPAPLTAVQIAELIKQHDIVITV